METEDALKWLMANVDQWKFFQEIDHLISLTAFLKWEGTPETVLTDEYVWVEYKRDQNTHDENAQAIDNFMRELVQANKAIFIREHCWMGGYQMNLYKIDDPEYRSLVKSFTELMK